MKNLSLLIKPVSSKCNIDCKYCFYKDEDKLRRGGCFDSMSAQTLEILVKRAFESATEQVDFVFQGGEPTLMGLDFYVDFIRLVAKYNVNRIKATYNLQTNGILIDDDWCDFLKKHDFLVGLSMDGDIEINDKNRVDYKGRGTGDHALKAINLMNKHGVQFNVLCVVTKNNFDKAKECYGFFKKIGVSYLQIIPALDPAGKAQEEDNKLLTAAQLETFLIDLFDVWIADFYGQNELRVTYFENIIVKMLNRWVGLCSMNGQCMIENVVESNGNVYPCDFYCTDEYLLGNIYDSDFTTLTFSPKAVHFVEQSKNINLQCKQCEYCGICLGGCKRYQMKDFNVYRNYFCPSYKKFFKHSYNTFLRIAELYKQSEG